MLDAHFALYPEEETTACAGCGHWYDGLSLRDGLCDRCWYCGEDDDDDEDY